MSIPVNCGEKIVKYIYIVRVIKSVECDYYFFIPKYPLPWSKRFWSIIPAFGAGNGGSNPPGNTIQSYIF